MILTTSFIGWLLLGEGGRGVKRREGLGESSERVGSWRRGGKGTFFMNQRDSVWRGGYFFRRI